MRTLPPSTAGRECNETGAREPGELIFTPRLRFKTLDELNAWLLDKYIAYAKAHTIAN